MILKKIKYKIKDSKLNRTINIKIKKQNLFKIKIKEL